MDSVRRRQQGESSRSSDELQEGIKGNTRGLLMQKVVVGLICLTLLLLYLYELRTRISLQRDIVEQTVAFHSQILQMQQHLASEAAQAKKNLASNICPPCPQCSTPVVDPNTNTMEKRLKLIEKKNTRLENALRHTSKEILHSKYGSGPLLVDLTLRLPEEVSDGSSEVLRLEMAPIDLMPVTVLYFLNQVTTGAWDGCSFIRNADHVLQASNRGKRCNAKLFASPDGPEKSVPFQEYSPQFPHFKHTIGLAGRPGGPDFYINLLDNVENHGPGGQSSCKCNLFLKLLSLFLDAIASEADNCFAKVIKGFEFIEKMHKLPIAPGDKGYRLLSHFVTIETAKLLRSNDSSLQ